MALDDVKHVEAVALLNAVLDAAPTLPIRAGIKGWLIENHPPPSAYIAAMRNLAGTEKKLSHRFELGAAPEGGGFDASVLLVGPEIDGGEDQYLPIFHVLFEPGVHGDPRGTLESMLANANAAMRIHLEGGGD